jgi:hypothetical protein
MAGESTLVNSSVEDTARIIFVLRISPLRNKLQTGKSGRVVDGSSLENWRTLTGIGGSNPSSSATYPSREFQRSFRAQISPSKGWDLLSSAVQGDTVRSTAACGLHVWVQVRNGAGTFLRLKD